MLKAYIVTIKWIRDAEGYTPHGTKIILADSRDEAEQILREWTKNYFTKMGLDFDENCKSFIEWEIRERPLEKGILWDSGIKYLKIFSPF